MKIATTPLDQRYLGIQLAAESLDIDFVRWNPMTRPVYDFLDEEKPDIVFCDIKFITKLFIRAFNEYNSVQTVLFGSGIPDGFRVNTICAKPNTSKVIRKHIESNEHSTLYLKDYANICSIFNGEYDQRLSCDIGYISNPTDPESMSKKINILSDLSKIATTRIVGETRIPLPNYLGTIKTERISSFLKSSKIVLDYHGDILLDAAANGCFVLSTSVNTLYPNLFESKVEDFIKNDKARRKISNKAQKEILNGNTCYHRLVEILESLKQNDLVIDTNKKIGEIL